VRGDGPMVAVSRLSLRQFSPRAWGWSEFNLFWRTIWIVLPTCVGMVRILTPSRMLASCSPHVRGDGPDIVTGAAHPQKFSPRAWGWSG